jgi:hypothetical protein
MRRYVIGGSALSCAMFAILFVRTVIEERAKGEYFMTYLWGGVLLFSLVLLAVRIRIKS